MAFASLLDDSSHTQDIPPSHSYSSVSSSLFSNDVLVHVQALLHTSVKAQYAGAVGALRA